MRILDAVALEGSDIVAITQLREEVLQDCPIALAAGDTKETLKMVLKVLLNPVVVEQRVVHVDEEDDWMSWHHSGTTTPIQRVSPGLWTLAQAA